MQKKSSKYISSQGKYRSLFHSELTHSELTAKENASIVKQSLKPEKQINTQKQTKVDISLLNFNISLLH